MFETGDVVTTPEGNIGQIANPHSGGRLDYYELSTRDSNVAVYTVILDNGKVERWTEKALSGDGHIRRSNALN